MNAFDELVGIVARLRGEGGYWYTLDLDCGCGTVTYVDGQVLGETCIDIAAPIAALAEEGIP